jgi:hypothetical protein
VREKCVNEMPPLEKSEFPGHFFRCWYPVGSPEYFEAKERIAATASTNGTAAGPVNSAAGVTAPGGIDVAVSIGDPS